MRLATSWISMEKVCYSTFFLVNLSKQIIICTFKVFDNYPFKQYICIINVLPYQHYNESYTQIFLHKQFLGRIGPIYFLFPFVSYLNYTTFLVWTYIVVLRAQDKGRRLLVPANISVLRLTCIIYAFLYGYIS